MSHHTNITSYKNDFENVIECIYCVLCVYTPDTVLTTAQLQTLWRKNMLIDYRRAYYDTC